MSIDSTWVKPAMVLYQNLASELMRHFALRGSKIKFLAISPKEVPSQRPDTDVNGHQWPRYYYSRGHTVDGLGRKRTVAVPFRNAVEEMTESATLLQDFVIR